MKFAGDLYDVLNIKLNIFYNLCTKAGAQESQYAIAFDTMLKGKAQSFYYQHLAQKDLPFDVMVTRMRTYFHTPENHQLFLNEWRTTMLKDIIATNPEKNLAECLEIVIERLQRTYQGLVQNFGSSEGSLAGQLVSACQGVPACVHALIRPATTFEGVASDLRSAVGLWMRCNSNDRSHQFTSQYDELEHHDSDTFYTDRRYNQNRTQRNNYRQNDHRRENQNDYRRENQNDHRRKNQNEYRRWNQNRRQNKKCFVCGKQNCWSTRHSIEERERSRRRFRTYVQDHDIDPDYDTFLAGFEGIDHSGHIEDSDDDKDDIEAYYSAQNS